MFGVMIPGALDVSLPYASAADGDVKSTVEINDSTTNGPTLTNVDKFGISVANIGDLDGDGVNDLAVGADGDDDGGTDRGAVHILYMNTDGSVDSIVEINSSTTNGPTLTNVDKFGISVANIGDLDGDGVNDLAVGADGDDGGSTDRGAVHILYMNTDGSVDSTVEINDSTTNGPTLADDDAFGRSVANIGDLDGDGVNDLAVGANLDDDGSTDRGAVHIIFMNTDGSVDSTVEINSSTTNGPTLASFDYFGYSVANIGDLDGDGVNDLAVGASGDNGGGANRGAVHIIFMNTDGSVDSTVEINDSTANGPTLANSDQFGMSVANIGDLDGDGVNDLAVGAGSDDGGNTDRGAVHIMFMNTDGSVDSTVEINDSTTNGPTLTNSDQFGRSVANIGDLDGDGVNDLAVGANLDDDGGTNRGAVHIMFVEGTLPPSTSTSTDSTSTGGGGGSQSCNSRGFGVGKSLAVYEVSYNFCGDTNSVDILAYSTCGSISAQLTTEYGRSTAGLSLDQPFIDDEITVYTGILRDDIKKFTVKMENKRNSFEDTFVINECKTTKRYSQTTGYTSSQQGTFGNNGIAISVPQWVKNTAGWWAEDKISEDEFVKGIEFLVKERIIDNVKTGNAESASSAVPTWVKNNAGWWAEGQIDDNSFVKGIEYLVKVGIIQVT